MGRSFQVLWAVINECDYWMVWSRYVWFCKNSIYLFIFGVPSITEHIYLLNVEGFLQGNAHRAHNISTYGDEK